MPSQKCVQEADSDSVLLNSGQEAILLVPSQDKMQAQRCLLRAGRL